MNWDNLDTIKHADEVELAGTLAANIALSDKSKREIDAQAIVFVEKARVKVHRKGLMETFLEEFGLSNKEGLALMCLAESLLRVPDAKTADKLIAEKISSGAWAEHKGQSDSWLVNASTLGLMLTGRIVDIEDDARKDISHFMQNLTQRVGAPVIRRAMMQAMRIMGEQFVVGRTINEALTRSERLGLGATQGLCSFDMLGEGARTTKDAKRYFNSYADAIKALGAARGGSKKEQALPEDINGISVKLSALDPHYDALHETHVMEALYPKLLKLAQAAASANINLCLDAEEADRLILSLKLFDRLARDPALADWQGLGLAVQAYQKRSLAVIKGVNELARDTGRRLMVRLVKGAYWDTEIKQSQINGHSDFPVWTRKSTTDLAYLACVKALFDAGRHVFPQFATHNAHTVAAIEHMAPDGHAYEYQRLHGMGEALYRAVNPARNVRIYAPVGAHEDLLPYLVRRLLENGANTSFVHKFLDEDVAPKDVARSPFSDAAPTRHPDIPKPSDLFGEKRENSRGLDLSQTKVRDALEDHARALTLINAEPLLVANQRKNNIINNLYSPFSSKKIGTITNAAVEDIAPAVHAARQAFPRWNAQTGTQRANIIRAMGQAIEDDMEFFVALLSQEAGKTFADSIAEIREAVDFCRYYAAEAEAHFSGPALLPGPAGETNHLSLMGRGVFVCISPWNFPLAIFTGQIAAALAAGNTVVAKPAEQTPLTAYEAVKRFYAAGLPKDTLQLLPGDGDTIGAALVEHSNIAGVCFTGSTDVAKMINVALAKKPGPIPVLIAETGGLNGMFVDTTALREQVIDDVIGSAFNAAGQRCSALRVLFLPDKTADHIIEGLQGAMATLFLGDPSLAATDIGPVIDKNALSGLRRYLDTLPNGCKIIARCDIPDGCSDGHFLPPTLVEIDSLDAVTSEQFGPVLHVLRYDSGKLDAVLDQFAAKGYGLTLGVHSRLQSFAKRVTTRVPAGNVYINRNIIGAVVGVQPFGGQGLSGTGPKAGGPHYLPRFATERTVTDNISAQGGDPALLNLSA